MLKRVHIAGVKSLLDVTVDLERFTVLVGPNGCGKSTLLDMMELCCVAATSNLETTKVFGSLADALDREGVAELRTSGRDLPMELSASDSDARQLRVSIPPSPPALWYQKATVEGLTSGESVTLSFTSKPDEFQSFQAFLGRAFDWAAQRLALSPAAVALPSPVGLETLDPSGYGLSTILKDLAGNDTSAFLALQADLRHVVPQFRELKFGKSQDENRRPLVTLDLVMQQGRIPADRASDGTLLALALLTATHNPDMPWLILMDDLDHGLHLSAQIALVEAIRRVMERRPNLQVVCTSHSPVLLDSFQPSEVRVMALDADGYTRVRSLAEHPPLDGWREGMSTGELWANLGEGWVVDG